MSKEQDSKAQGNDTKIASSDVSTDEIKSDTRAEVESSTEVETADTENEGNYEVLQSIRTQKYLLRFIAKQVESCKPSINETEPDEIEGDKIIADEDTRVKQENQYQSFRVM
ncbi:hypothetical protein OS493_039408, partial [Desmophyllum pertusum]